MPDMRYSTHNNHPVQRLHYAWTGWPKEGTSLPPLPPLDPLTSSWLGDGMQLIATDADTSRVMLTFEAKADIAPTFLAQRAKGRLQHAYRASGTPVSFSRKVAVRSLGENVSDIVEAYVRDQLQHVDLADPRYRQMLADAAFENRTLSLSDPVATQSGRYWYNLHVVLVTAARYRVGGHALLQKLRTLALDCARDIGVDMKALAIMPDHIHLALRGAPEQSPLAIGVALQEATAKAIGCRLWQDRFYAGTFSEYTLALVRERAQMTSGVRDRRPRSS